MDFYYRKVNGDVGSIRDCYTDFWSRPISELLNKQRQKNKQNICKLNYNKVGLSTEDDKLNHSATFMSDDRICISKRGRNMDFKE